MKRDIDAKAAVPPVPTVPPATDSTMDFDKILAKCGNNQRYQYVLLAVYSYVMFVTAMHNFSQNIIGFVPQHWCYHEQLENRSFAEIAAIYAHFDNPSCTRLQRIDGDNVTVSTQRCERWIYQYDYGYRSMNTELNWVCESAYKARVGQSLFFVGSMCGTLLFGLLGDKIGRVKTLILANMCGFLGDFLTIFTQSLTAFSITRFVSGLAADADSYLMYILVLEYVSPSMRNVGLNASVGIFYSVGLITACWLAVFAGNWRTFLIYSSLPILLVALSYFVVQESAQWLITRQRCESAVKRLKCVAKLNRRLVSEQDYNSFRSYCQLCHKQQSTAAQQKPNLLQLLQTPRLRRMSLKLLLIFTIISVCYNAIARNVEGLGISPTVMFTLFALTLPPSGLLQAQLQHRYGRKLTAVSALLLTGLFTAAVGFIMSQRQVLSNVLLVAMSMGARLGISVCIGAGLQLLSELLPTCVRSRGVAVAHIAGAAASFMSPHIQLLGSYMRAAPAMLLCLLFFVGAYTALLLPETRNKKLPMSLDDGEQFGKGERWYDFLRQTPNEEATPATRDVQQKLLNTASA